MANFLKMEKKQTVLALLRLGWSYRGIERETGVRRETISKYDPSRDSKPAKVAPGSGEQKRPRRPPGLHSLCEPFRKEIEKKLLQGLQAKGIWQDLVFEHGFDGAYNSVKRFCRKLKAESPRVFARVETPPGQDMQIDFGQGALTRTESGRYRRPHVFKAVLCHSRHSYEEVVWRQEGKAVETAALWTPWKNERIVGNGLALLARFPQLHTASTIGYTNRFHPARFAGPGIERSGQPMPSSRAYSTPAPGSRPYSLSTEGFTRD